MKRDVGRKPPDLPPPTMPPSPAAIAVLAAFPVGLFALLAVSILLSAPRAHPDCAMYLQTGSLLLEGKKPYVDFIYVNPPMIMYLSALPAAVARASGTQVNREDDSAP